MLLKSYILYNAVVNPLNGVSHLERKHSCAAQSKEGDTFVLLILRRMLPMKWVTAADTAKLSEKLNKNLEMIKVTV